MRDCMWNGNCWQWHRLGIRKVDLVKVEACWIWERLKMISDCLRIRGNGFDDVQRNEMRTRGKGWRLWWLREGDRRGGGYERRKKGRRRAREPLYLSLHRFSLSLYTFFLICFFSSFIRIVYPEIHTQIFIQTPCELMFSSLVLHCVFIFCIQNGSYLVSFVLCFAFRYFWGDQALTGRRAM